MEKKICKTKDELVIPNHLRTRCLVYTRVMGYHRPVESFNLGKQGEHRQRVQFQECVK
jgi:hypothetical protein